MPLPSSLACVRRAAVALVAAALALAAACGENPVAPGTGGVGGSTAGAPAVGTVLRLNTYINPSDPCDSVRSGFRGGRVAAVGARSIIVADTANPAGGFTSADYASFAATFDTLVYPVGVRHFGEPTDLDRNGRVIVFFTAAVNALTPRNVDYIVGGYFSARDLFPRGGRDACVGSNDGELFYMLAPDPSGAVNGNARSRDYVLRTSMGVLAHEFQHLISASRRLYVVQTANFQDRVWLDEGLSHIAEELTYYRASGLGPMRRLTLDSVRRTTPRLNALNNYNLSNLGRLTSYLAAPEDNSPYAPDDSLATRGATWSFLRYAADRAVAAGAAASDSVLFFRLVNSSQVGLTNLRTAVTGAAGTPVVLADWFRDWAVSHYADGLVPGLDVRYTQPSWVFRDVLAGLPSNNGAYPLRTRTLAEAQAQSIALAGGGTAYFRFTAPAGGRATITIRGAGGAAPSANLRPSLVALAGGGAPVTPYPAGTTTVTADGGATGASGYALVVFNADTVARTRTTVTVQATGLGGALAARLEGDARPAYVGPTLARLAAGGDDPVVTDAPVNARLRTAGGAAALARRAGAARAAYAARRAGDAP